MVLIVSTAHEDGVVSLQVVSERPNILSKDRLRTAGNLPQEKSSSASIIIGAVIVLLIIVGIAKTLMSRPDPATMNRSKVVAAGEDILPGTQIGFAQVRYVDIPNEYMEQGMFKATNLAVGRVSKCFIPARNPLSESLLFPKGQTLSNQLETHERAITLKLSEEAMVDHLLFPGDKVDILSTVTKNGKRYTKTLSQDVRVLMSVTKSMLESRGVRAENRNRVTLAVTPDVAEFLTEAEQAGTLKLVLRNRLSATQSHLRGAGESDLVPAGLLEDITTGGIAPAGSSKATVGELPPPPAIPEPPPIAEVLAETNAGSGTTAAADPVKWIVEVFSGSKRETYAF